MLPSPRRPHSGSAANRSPVSWPVWPILSRERSQNPECKKNILTAILKPCNKLPLKYSEKLVYAMQRTYMQGLAKRQFPGLVTFGSAVAYHFCLALPAAFTQPGDHLFAEPCNICCLETPPKGQWGVRKQWIIEMTFTVATWVHFFLPTQTNQSFHWWPWSLPYLSWCSLHLSTLLGLHSSNKLQVLKTMLPIIAWLVCP